MRASRWRIPAEIVDVLVLPVAGHAGFGAALDTYLAARGVAAVGAVAIAAAGPREGNSIKLTNAPWRIDGAAVSARLGGVPVRVLNDLEAVAHCLPGLASGEYEILAPGAPGPGAPKPRAPGPLPMLAANVGTGFGAAVAVPARGGWAVLGTEAGHMSLAPMGPAEKTLLEGVRTVEDAFSGPAYARLFGAATEDGGESVRPVGNAAQARARPIYSEVFGRVLGDLVLATGAWGGVYLTGGVMSDLHRIIEVETMLQAFRQKGKMAELMQRIPVCRITADAPAFRALADVEVD